MMLGADYIRLVLSRWKLVAALVLGATLVAWLVTVLILAQNPKFEASARLNVVPTSEELGYANRFVRGSTFDGGSTLLGTYAEFAHTRPVVAPIVDRYVAEQARGAGQTPAAWIAANTGGPSLSPGRLLAILNYGEAPVVPLKQEMIDELIEKTKIETVEGTYLLKITVEWDDARAAAWFANALADAIIARAERMSTKSGTELAGTLEARLAEKQAELAATLRRSRDTKAAVGVVDIDRQKQSLLEAQIAEQSQLTSDRATLQANQSQVAGLRSQTSGKMSTAQAAIEQTLAVEGPKATGLARGVAIREGRVAQIRGQIDALGRHEDGIRALDDRAQQLRAEVAALTERVSFSQTENLANAPRIQLIERAVPPLTRSSPKMLLNTALGFVAGCALAGMALLILGEAPVKRAPEVVEDSDEPDHVEVAPVPEPAPRPPRPARPEADPNPAFAAQVTEMPRPAPPPSAPAFASLGSLALARDVEANPIMGYADLAPTSARPELVEACPELRRRGLPFSEPQTGRSEQEGQSFDGPGPNEGRHLAEAPQPLTLVPGEAPAPQDPVFGYVLPPPRGGKRYDTAEVRGIGAQVAGWLGSALEDDRPLTIAATGDATDAQRLYQLIHDYRAALGAPVATSDWSEGARALPRAAGKPLIYAGGGFGTGSILAHGDGAIVVVVADDDADTLEAEARRLARFAGRAVHVVPLAG